MYNNLPDLTKSTERVIKNIDADFKKIYYHKMEIVGLRFYDKHRNHVNELFNLANGKIEVTKEDSENPELWKPEHWRWFLDKFD